MFRAVRTLGRTTTTTNERSSAIHYVLSRRGKPQLLYKGYLYNADTVLNGRSYWRCAETRRGSCMARLVSTATTVFEKQPQHDHPPKNSRLHGKRLLVPSRNDSFDT